MEQLMRNGVTTHSSEETESVAFEYASYLPEDCIIALHGDLGVGKTTWVRGLAQAWKITCSITSPTFSLFRIYTGMRNLIHMDAYRIEDESQMDSLLIDDFLISPYCFVIEWPEKVRHFLPKETWHLRLNILESGVHFIQRIESPF